MGSDHGKNWIGRHFKDLLQGGGGIRSARMQKRADKTETKWGGGTGTNTKEIKRDTEKRETHSEATTLLSSKRCH